MNRRMSLRGRVHQLLAVAAGTALVGSLAVIGVSSSAGAAVMRNQIETMNVIVSVFSPAATSTNVHEYTVTVNPCDGTFTGWGGGYSSLAATSPYVTEVVSGTYVGGVFTINSTYNGTTYGSPYTYTVGPVAVPLTVETTSTAFTWSTGVPAGSYPVWVTLNATSASSFVNHGQYVSSVGGGDDAAHSCIGMPVTSQS
jgi:hypothetical protein